jgi:hypothetical protein
VHEGARLAAADLRGDLRRAERRGHGEVAARHGLAEAEDVGGDTGVEVGEQGARSAEPGRDLVED